MTTSDCNKSKASWTCKACERLVQLTGFSSLSAQGMDWENTLLAGIQNQAMPTPALCLLPRHSGTAFFIDDYGDVMISSMSTPLRRVSSGCALERPAKGTGAEYMRIPGIHFQNVLTSRHHPYTSDHCLAPSLLLTPPSHDFT